MSNEPPVPIKLCADDGIQGELETLASGFPDVFETIDGSLRDRTVRSRSPVLE